MLVLRPWIARKMNDKNATKTIYLTMYLIPALVLVHGVLGGVICECCAAVICLH